MNFTNIHSDIPFDCTEGLQENLQDVFARKLLSNSFNDEDFNSYWEMGKRPTTAQLKNPKKVCDYKCISLSSLSEENEDEIRTLFNTTPKFKPKATKYKYYCKMKFQKDAGVSKESPSINNIYHCNFYKADGFSVKMISILDIKSL